MSDYGIQLYSLRDRTPSDMEGTLLDLSAIGYRSVEFAGFFNHPAEKIAAMLKQSHLKASGTHTGLQALMEDEQGIADYHLAIGCHDIIIPGHDLDCQEKIDGFILSVNALLPRLADRGLRLSYHNHSFEFLPNKDGSHIYEQLIEKTALCFELDTFWAYAAGRDPLALMEELGPRLTFIHLKDGLKNGEGRPLGLGGAPVKAVHEKAVQMKIPMVVESETLTPSGTQEAQVCMDYLNTL